MRGINHLDFPRPTPTRKFYKQPFPNAPLGPTDKAIVDCRRWTVFRRTITPAAAALDHMKDATDDTPIIDPGFATNVFWQKRLDLAPLLVGQPKQTRSHQRLPCESGARESPDHCVFNQFNGFWP